MVKRILIGAAILLGLLVVAVVSGGFWLTHEIGAHLAPPPGPAGQPSIASHASSEPAADAPAPQPAFSWESIAQPPKSARPWTRWWWPGGDVDTDTLLRQLDALDAAQFGGAEIQPFLSGMVAVKEPAVMDRVYSFDTPDYYEKLHILLRAAAQRGWQIDLTHFSGWPPGGPEVNLEDSLTEIVYGETTLSGGKSVVIDLPKPKPGPGEYIFSMIEFAGADFINFPADHARVLSVMAARTVSGKHSRNPFNLDDTVTLDRASLQLLTDSVKEGRLHWNAPPGDWRIIVSYLMPSGEVPMGAAQRPQGFVIDHLRKPQVLGHYEYAFGARTGLADFYGKGLRGFFNDSLEFRLKRMGVEDILTQFRRRRGYDLEPWLPTIYVEGIDNVYLREILGIHAAPDFRLTDFDERIRHDYQLTLSDLVIERFVETSAAWARARGLTSRGQSYGMDIDLLRALGANTIPETEQLWAGGSDAGLKMASSAAALYGRPLVSSESFVWINRDYTTTARKIKAAADKLLLAGVNHIVYHGTPYPWRGGEPSPFGDEGWMPFSGPQNPAHFSTNVSPGNTSLWPYIAALNTYIARGQNLLRQGAPDIDVLIYYPFLGFHGANPDNDSVEVLLNGALPDADPKDTAREDPMLTWGRRQLDRVLSVPPGQPDRRDLWVRQMLPLLRELDRHGITWGWVNGHALRTGKLKNGELTASGGRYRLLLLPNVDSIEADALNALREQVAAGIPVVLAGSRPAAQPGFFNAEQGDAVVRQRVRELIASGADAVEFDAALAERLQTRLQQPLRYLRASAIKNHRRRLPDGGAVYFFANQSAQNDTVELQPQLPQPLWWFDAASGAAWPLQPASGPVKLTLGGFDSRFLIAGVPMPRSLQRHVGDGAAFAAAAQRWTLPRWDFSLGELNEKSVELFDWRDRPALAHARGPGLYHSGFGLAKKRDDARYLLNLGLVQGSASVRVNGKDAGRASFPPFIVDVSDLLHAGENSVDIQVLAPLRNDFVGRALAGDKRYSHMSVYAEQLVAAGLMGPVAIAETIEDANNTAHDHH